MVRPLTLAALALLLSFAPANPLLAVTPDTAAVVLEIAPDAGVPAELVEALAGLGWEEHLDTLMRVAGLLDTDLPLDENPTDMAAELLDEIAFACPPLADALEGIQPAGLFGDALVSVHQVGVLTGHLRHPLVLNGRLCLWTHGHLLVGALVVVGVSEGVSE